MLPLLAPDSSTWALPETHALRWTGVEPMDGLMLADSPTRRIVTTVPSDSVLEISPPGSGTKVSAFAAPVDSRPKAMVAAAPTPAACATYLRLIIDFPSWVEFASA